MANGKVQMANGRKIFLENTAERCRFPNQGGATNRLFTKKNFRPFEFCHLPFEIPFNLSGIPVGRGTP
jgi:hypothetical protein